MSCGMVKAVPYVLSELVVASNQKKSRRWATCGRRSYGRSKIYQVLLATTAFTGMGKKLADVKHGWEKDGTTAAVVVDWPLPPATRTC